MYRKGEPLFLEKIDRGSLFYGDHLTSLHRSLTFSIVRCCYDVNVIVQSLKELHAVVKRTENNNVIKG